MIICLFSPALGLMAPASKNGSNYVGCIDKMAAAPRDRNYAMISKNCIMTSLNNMEKICESKIKHIYLYFEIQKCQ